MADKKNMLEYLQSVGEVRWSLKSYSPKVYVRCKRRTPAEIKQQVFQSNLVQSTIKQLTETSEKSKKELEKEAKAILDEMSHNFQMTTIRGFGFVLSKLFKKLFTGVYINEDGIERTRKLASNYPILFMPTHRSYIDFLLVSYVCFMYNLPLPTIAAGLDFLAMKGVQVLLRNAGAFFIRRAFGGDQLYWSIFTEYVQTHVLNGDFPVEFFVEGTRSRSAKSLSPKLGFLMAALEPYFKARLTDIAIVPINISYERTLEENLYTYELLGVPKPKESTQGLVKARQILHKCFGSIYVHFEDPIILSRFCQEHKFKRICQPGPRLTLPLTNGERSICKKLALHAIRRNQVNSTIFPFNIVASVILVSMQQSRFEISFSELTEDVIRLKNAICTLGAKTAWNDRSSAQDQIKRAISIHDHITLLNGNDEEKAVIKIFQNDAVQLPTNLMDWSALKGHKLQMETIGSAVPYIYLSHYTNHLLHIFVRISFVLVSLRALHPLGIHRDQLFLHYQLLEKIFLNEFIFEEDHTEKDFSSVLSDLNLLGLIEENTDIKLKSSDDKLVVIICHLIEPFLIGYRIVCQVLLDSINKNLVTSSPVLVRDAQAYAEYQLRAKKLSHLSVFSLDLLNNAVLGLINCGAIKNEKRSQENFLHSVPTQLHYIAEQLGVLIKETTIFDAPEISGTIPSKL